MDGAKVSSRSNGVTGRMVMGADGVEYVPGKFERWLDRLREDQKAEQRERARQAGVSRPAVPRPTRTARPQSTEPRISKPFELD